MFKQFYYWLMSYAVEPTATEKIDGVLSGFTAMVARLDDAIEQAEWEIEASTERVDVAWNQFLEVRDNALVEQDQISEALTKAETARANIAALTGAE